ncbi:MULTISPECIES: hypothetical protein [unclassified Streptomyces]|uniref:hypothetical protein n=1 Tax=unclassified Streptomyces TaxID=2593676 RepID=UPI0037F2D22E
MPLALGPTAVALTVVAPESGGGGHGWALFGFAVVALAAGVPLWLLVRGRRAAGDAEQVRERTP